eukprot:CAMPEP_0196575320 /NCGR_PEP_ID=MMETSP1081-20130531/4825_1 /TAXON_ID=36882 /ORGANISM="Pyramimonas amylifera, Strain CCMP720" /LENGTH=1005 /DNA_ID=CAMNT_0041893583 /DNA_START=53 /DNA_END=3071 /DNA_ORIENTATION=-
MAGRGRGLEAALPAWMTAMSNTPGTQPIGRSNTDSPETKSPASRMPISQPPLGSQGVPSGLIQKGPATISRGPQSAGTPPASLSVLPPHLFPPGMPPKLPPPPPISLQNAMMQRPSTSTPPTGIPSGAPPTGMLISGAPPAGMLPGTLPSGIPQGAPPAGMPPGVPPAGMPPGPLPGGMPPNGVPPGGMPPAGMPPGMPPQGLPPGMPPGALASRPPPGLPPPHLQVGGAGRYPAGVPPAQGVGQGVGLSAPPPQQQMLQQQQRTGPLPVPPPGLPPGLQGSGAPHSFATSILPTLSSGGTPVGMPGGSTSNWTEHKSPDGRKYFYNGKTKQSSWEKPKELMTAIEIADSMTPWREWTAPDGRKFYYNKETKQSKWTVPPELQQARDQAAAMSSQSQVSQAPVAQTPAPTGMHLPLGYAGAVPGLLHPSPLPSTTTPSSVSAPSVTAAPPTTAPPGIAPSVSAAPASEPANSAAPVVESIAPKVNISDSAPAPVTKAPLTFATKQEAKDAFKAMLTHCGIKSDWSWEATMRTVISDERYGALKTLGEKKACFNEWAMARGKVEKEEARQRAKKVRENFCKMLKEKEELKSWMRYSEATPLFEKDPRWLAVESSRERSELFDDVKVDIEKKEKEHKKQQRKERMAAFRKLLEETSSVKVDSQWRKVHEKLEDDPVCKALDSADRLDVFQEYMRDLEKVEAEQKLLEKEQRKRQERKNRDAFKELLGEHTEAGKITVRTSWKEYVMLCKHEDAYQALCSNLSGSKPRELFDDCLETLEKQHEKDKSMVKDALKLQKWVVKSDSSLEELETVLLQMDGGIGDKVKAMPKKSLASVHLELVERARQREEKEAKKRKRALQDFQDLLYSCREITPTSLWQESKEMLEGEPEFKALEDEGAAEQAFNAYVEQLTVKAQEKAERRAKEKDKKKEDKEERSSHKKSKKHKKRHRSDSEHSDKGNTSGEEEVQKKKRHKKSRKHSSAHEEEDETDEEGSKLGKKRDEAKEKVEM